MKKYISILLFILFAAPAAMHAQNTDSLVVATLKVANVHCNNDMPTIKKRLLNQEGIDEVNFSPINGDVSVFSISFHSAVTNIAAIERVIETTPGCGNPQSTPYKVKKDEARKKKKHE